LMVAADAPDLSCEEQQQIIDWALCISRWTSPLLTPVLSSPGSFCSAISVLHDWSHCKLLGAAIARLVCHNCCR
jgi:hypothetical protein